MIRLSENIPKSEKLKRIDEIVDVLCLRKCLNTSKYTVELHIYVHQFGSRVVRAFAPRLGVRGFDSRLSQAKDFKLVVEGPLSSARHIKGSSTKKLVECDRARYHTTVPAV